MNNRGRQQRNTLPQPPFRLVSFFNHLLYNLRLLVFKTNLFLDVINVIITLSEIRNYEIFTFLGEEIPKLNSFEISCPTSTILFYIFYLKILIRLEVRYFLWIRDVV